MEMANELHITQEKMRRIDKATIVKLAIDYIKAFEILCRCHNPQSLVPGPAKQVQAPPLRNPLQLELQNRNQIASVESINGTQARDLNGKEDIEGCDLGQQTTYQMPKLSTASIFAPKTEDMNKHFLVVDECNGKSSLVLKPDTEVLDEDDLTHLAPQAGDVSIPLEAEPLDDIILDKLL